MYFYRIFTSLFEKLLFPQFSQHVYPYSEDELLYLLNTLGIQISNRFLILVSRLRVDCKKRFVNLRQDVLFAKEKRN